MPMYYFQVENDGEPGERQGLRLNDLAEARSHAKTLDDAIRFSGHSVQARRAIVVTDEHGAIVYEVRRDA
jgi:hypothetical protein